MSTCTRWQAKSLRQLAVINYGKSPAAILSDECEYPVFGTAGPERFGKSYLYDGDSVILGRKGTIDRVHFATGKFWVIDTAYYLSNFNGVLPLWLYYFLQTVDLAGLNEATGVPSLSRETLYRIQITTPPLLLQAKVANVLSTMDRAIAHTEALVTKHQCIKTGLTHDLLSRGIDEQGNLRSYDTHEFKETSLGTIPAGWDIRDLGEVAELVTSGSRGWARYYADEGAAFLRIGNLTRDHINLRLEDLVFVNPPNSSEGKRTALAEGDLLISITADLGIIGVIPAEFGEAYVNQHIALVRLAPGTASPRFIGYLLSSHYGRMQFEMLNESGAKAGLNLPTIKKLKVFLPQEAEQRQIAEILDSATQTIRVYRQQLAKLLSLKAALMQDLVSEDKCIDTLLELERELEPKAEPKREKMYAAV